MSRHRSAPRRPPKNGGSRLAAAAASLGRRGAEADGLLGTDIGCADCRGVLCVQEVGDHGWLTFRCRVGHAFSTESLLLSKENQLEESLWMTIEVLEEIAQLYGALSTLGSPGVGIPGGSLSASRLARARRHLRMLRRIVETEGPTPAVPPRERPNESR